MCHFSVLSETEVRVGQLCVGAKNVQGLLFDLKLLQFSQRVRHKDKTPPPCYLGTCKLMLNCVKTEAGGRHPPDRRKRAGGCPRLFTCAACGKMSPFNGSQLSAALERAKTSQGNKIWHY